MIEINNLTAGPVDEKFLKRVAEKVLKGENKEETGLSIVLVGEGRMRKLNKKYRGKNRGTDVLAFSEKSEIKNQKSKIKFIKPLEAKLGLGEIVICLREVKKNAKKYASRFEKELVRILIHGILHLLGYEHEKSEIEAKKMKEREEYYFSQIK